MYWGYWTHSGCIDIPTTKPSDGRSCRRSEETELVYWIWYRWWTTWEILFEGVDCSGPESWSNSFHCRFFFSFLLYVFLCNITICIVVTSKLLVFLTWSFTSANMVDYNLNVRYMTPASKMDKFDRNIIMEVVDLSRILWPVAWISSISIVWLLSRLKSPIHGSNVILYFVVICSSWRHWWRWHITVTANVWGSSTYRFVKAFMLKQETLKAFHYYSLYYFCTS